jgi:16S rRNA (guanine966-N2)-methyltransferase
LRIISGKHRGKHLQVPGNFRARPTTDFAKTGLFNIVSNLYTLDDSDVLDLFAGTGSIGFEFASRGARYVEMVEKNFTHYSFIKKTIPELKMDNVQVYKTDVFVYLPRITRKFDIVFADPPFDMEKIETLPDLVFQYSLLKENGIFVLEHSSNHDFSQFKEFQMMRKYGSVNFSFFQLAPNT